jgi:two-component system, response regulator PdtaR
MVGPPGELQPSREEKIDRSILVVEDEVLVRMVLADQLREAGYCVVEARDADEALELLQHDALDVKVVITDIEMPGSINGMELAGVIRTEYPLTKVILMSGGQGRLDGLRYDGFFPKPYDAPAIINRVRSLLD